MTQSSYDEFECYDIEIEQDIDGMPAIDLLRLIEGQLIVLDVEGWHSCLDYITDVETESEVAVCPQCDGKGIIVEVAPEECLACGWSGDANESCPICNDTGRTDDGVQYVCPVCDGNGELWHDRTVTYHLAIMVSNLFI